MITALDTSVILDVISNDAAFAERSLAALRAAASEGSLVVCEWVVAEIRPALSEVDVEQLMADWSLVFRPSSKESALLAGAMWKEYHGRSPAKRRVLPDFLIGAHAALHCDRLLARDRGYYRDYFKKLNLIEP